jgi:nitrous oxidase accessory protein NosD
MLVVLVFSISLVMPVRAASTIIVPSPAYSIQDAINLAASGDEVLVLAGTYDQSVLIDKPITLKGDGAILRPVTAPLQLGSVIRIISDYVTVQNLEIDGTGEAVCNGICDSNGDHVTISHVVVHDMTNDPNDAAGIGIILWGYRPNGYNHGIDDCIVDRATVYNTAQMGIIIAGVMESSGITLLSEGNVISRCNVYNTWIGPTTRGGGAVQIGGALNCVIKDNNIHQNTLGGFYAGLCIFGSAEGNIIKGNNLHHNAIGYVALIYDSPWVAFDGHSPTVPTLVGNKIHNNQYGDPTGWVF